MAWLNLLEGKCTIIKTASLELMWDESFSACVFQPPPVGFCVPIAWRLSTIHILQIDSAIELAWIAYEEPTAPCVFVDGEIKINLCWDKMVQLAKSYTWAWKDTLGEVFFDPANNNWIQWQYQIPLLDGLKAKNSNTFARYILKNVFGREYELPTGSHPGAAYPEDSTDPGYCSTPL